MEKLMRLPEVREFTQRSTTRIYADMEAGTFPRPIKIGPRAVAWTTSSLNAWLQERIAERELA